LKRRLAARRGSPPTATIVSTGNQDRASLWPSISIDPRGRPATIAEADAGSAPLEIVPLLAVEGPEKFRIVQPVQLAANPSIAGDEPGVAMQVEQASSRPGLAEEGRMADE
jgi:hypothetical protein